MKFKSWEIVNFLFDLNIFSVIKAIQKDWLLTTIGTFINVTFFNKTIIKTTLQKNLMKKQIAKRNQNYNKYEIKAEQFKEADPSYTSCSSHIHI